MKKPNRRSKPASHAAAADSSPPAKEGDLKQQQHYEKRVRDLENENRALKRETEALKSKMGSGSPTTVDGSQKMKQDDNQKLHALEEQVVELKRKLNAHFQLSTQKQKNGEGRLLHDEVQKLKVQKVELLCKMKLQSVQFRQSKASLEKEVLQLKKEQRRNKYEMHKLLALNQRQKQVLQRKSEEASMATKRLKELLIARKTSSQRTSGTKAGHGPGIQGIEIELKVAERAEAIRAEYERQMEEMADEVRKFEEEAEMLRQENFSCLLQDKEADCSVRESELSDLKDEVARLSNLVSQLGIAKAKVLAKDSPACPVTSSASIGSSIDSSDMGTSESDNFGTASESDLTGGDVNVVKNYVPGACCSCSKRSLCKTMKCECRAAESSCRTSCGCAASKCTNREVALTGADGSIKSVAVLESVRCSGTTGMEKDALASQPTDLNNDSGPRRKPLHEIQKSLINSSPIKPGQLLRGQNPVSQVDHLDQSFFQPEITADAKREEKNALANVPLKLTRVTRGKCVSNLR